MCSGRSLVVARPFSITFLHGEDMQPFDAHGKKCVGMIVQMDAVGRKKAGDNSLTHLRRMDQSSAPTTRTHTRTVSQARRTRQEQNFGMNSGETNSADK
jgi:hypothetical protein